MTRRRMRCGVCEAAKRGVSYEEWMDDHLLRMHDRIRRNAYTCTGVLGEGDRPPWVYTTGLLDTFAHPELVVVGLHVEEAYELITEWADVVKGCQHPLGGGVVDDLAGFPAKFVEVHASHCGPDSDWFCDWYRYHDFVGCTPFPLRVLQLVYADDWGHFPGDRGYSLGDQQPLLDR